MDAIIAQMQDAVEGQIVGSWKPPSSPTNRLIASQDFEGQRVSEIVSTVLLSLTSVSPGRADT